jgi:hypothetical protein
MTQLACGSCYPEETGGCARQLATLAEVGAGAGRRLAAA